MGQAHSLLLGAVAKYRPLVGDDVQIQIAAMFSEEGRLLASEHPDVCLDLLLGHPSSGPSYTTYLPEDTVNRETALTAAIIGGSTKPSNMVATEQGASAEIAVLWKRVQDDGFDISTVGRAAASTAEQRSQCLAFAAFMQDISLLPAQRAGALMRYLNKSS